MCIRDRREDIPLLTRHFLGQAARELGVESKAVSYTHLDVYKRQIQRFAEDFPGTRTIRLEQNYRSTHNILKAANALIAHNAARLGKNLWTADADGEPIQIYNAFNEVDEARFVVCLLYTSRCV